MMIVSDIVSSLQLKNVKIVCSRAEAFVGEYDFLLGRAVSALPNFLSFSSHLMRKNSSMASASAYDGRLIDSGLLYLKGGNFTSEISEANIDERNTKLFPVSDMGQVISDKYVLHIPAKDILQFHRRNLSRS